MYDPIWYTEKTISAIAEGAAFVAAVVLLVVPWDRSAPTVADPHGRAANPRA
jgi:hypothetical protein